MATITPITVPDLTTEVVDGTGVFDVLMRANKAHLEQEFAKNRIKGPEYSTVYLGSLEVVMNAALQFLLQKDKTSLEAELLDQQILLTKAEVLKANAELAQIEAQTSLLGQQLINAQAELAILQANALKVPAEVTLLDKQALLTEQQTANLVAEGLNIPKQGLQIDAQTNLAAQQESNLVAEGANIPKQGLILDAELLNIPKQGTLIDKQVLDIEQKTLNAIIEGTVLTATECKLRGEFDLIIANKLKADQETALLLQKVSTEKAQVSGSGVDADSVIGRQKALFTAQTDGFARDAEQKATKIMVDTWNTRRMTDEGTDGNLQNNLDDAAVGGAVEKLMAGINVFR